MRSRRPPLTQAMFRDAGLPVMDLVTYIVPLMVGDPVRAKKISDILLAEYGVYVQPINFRPCRAAPNARASRPARRMTKR